VSAPHGCRRRIGSSGWTVDRARPFVEGADHAADRFVPPEEFADYAAIARGKGFLLVSATPLTRSSYHADADFASLRAAREAQRAASA